MESGNSMHDGSNAAEPKIINAACRPRVPRKQVLPLSTTNCFVDNEQMALLAVCSSVWMMAEDGRRGTDAVANKLLNAFLTQYFVRHVHIMSIRHSLTLSVAVPANPDSELPNLRSNLYKFSDEEGL